MHTAPRPDTMALCLPTEAVTSAEIKAFTVQDDLRARREAARLGWGPQGGDRGSARPDRRRAPAERGGQRHRARRCSVLAAGALPMPILRALDPACIFSGVRCSARLSCLKLNVGVRLELETHLL